MNHRSTQSLSYLLSAFKMLLQPGIRLFVIIPLIINIVIFALAIWLLTSQIGSFLDSLLAGLPSWLHFISTPLQVLFFLTLLIPVYFTFSILGNLLASPFLGLLAEVVEKKTLGFAVSENDNWKDFIKLVPRALKRELRRITYYLPRFILLLVLSFIPIINLVAAPLLILFNAWMLTIQYVDYAADNQKFDFPQTLAKIRKNRFQALTFGLLLVVLMAVPGVNLIVIPTAVIAGTQFWIFEYQKKSLS